MENIKELYIVRDDYSLKLFETEPHLFFDDIWCVDEENWFVDGEDSIKLNPDWFPEVTKENSPKKIKLIVE